MCYKLAPPSKGNEVNLSLLSSAIKSEIGTNAPVDLGCPLTYFAWFSPFRRESGENQTVFFFFDKQIVFSSMLHFLKLGLKQK